MSGGRVANLEAWLCGIEPVNPRRNHHLFNLVRSRVSRSNLRRRAAALGVDFDEALAGQALAGQALAGPGGLGPGGLGPGPGRPGPGVLLGAAESREDGYFTLDRRPVADVVADVRELPFCTESIARLAAFDILEHFWKAETRAILDEWRRVLMPEGRIAVRVPNIVYLAQLVRHRIYLDDAIKNIYGGHRWGDAGELDTHHWGWTPATIVDDLEASGFCVIANDFKVNMTVEALALK